MQSPVQAISRSLLTIWSEVGAQRMGAVAKGTRGRDLVEQGGSMGPANHRGGDSHEGGDSGSDLSGNDFVSE
jgi:hypothetical protein